jgi:iron-sulfur cluster repair protein YtfE (RIC family)
MTTEKLQTPTAAADGQPGQAPLADWLIRDLVGTFPRTMSLLAPLGIDLCCGGGHPLGEALDLHGIDRDEVLPQVARVVAESGGQD